MALITCPECGCQVSDQAEKCPKCAYPIRPKMPEPKPQQPNIINTTRPEVIVQSKEGCFLQTLNAGCMIIAIIIGLIVVITFFILYN
jgi:uncharacterized membrane protein YvbJ